MNEQAQGLFSPQEAAAIWDITKTGAYNRLNKLNETDSKLYSTI